MSFYSVEALLVTAPVSATTFGITQLNFSFVFKLS